MTDNIGLIKKNMGRQYKLPVMKTTFGIKRNPLQDNKLVQEMTDECFEISMMTDNQYSKIKDVTIFTSYFHPFCKDIDKYVNLARLQQFFFILDDHIECEYGDFGRGTKDSKAVFTEVYDALDKVLDKNSEVSIDSWRSYISAFYTALTKVTDEYAEDQTKRFIQTYRDYIDGNQKETMLIESKRQVETVDELLKIRVDSIGSYCVFQMIEYADDIHLTDEEWDDPLLQKYLEYGTIIIILANDIHSFEKEFKQNKNDFSQMYNVVAVLIKPNGCSIDEGIIKAKELFENYEMKTKVIKQQLLDRPDNREDVKKFIEHADYVIGGNFAGGLTLKRYNQVHQLND